MVLVSPTFKVNSVTNSWVHANTGCLFFTPSSLQFEEYRRKAQVPLPLLLQVNFAPSAVTGTAMAWALAKALANAQASMNDERVN